MSASIAIPRRSRKTCDSADNGSESSGNASSWKYGSYESVKEDDIASTPQKNTGARRPSLMSESIVKSEHTVIDVGSFQNPRLITCVKASQGFDWNQEIFLPSHSSYNFDNLERKKDPVQEIVLTDEEVANMFPS
ncbi:unnamed protein product [Periconia digitata]|uniref:Uncharacterized protein n=1 Tax=Periconia digitata TaxID=1303443 RepID=A0A9W4UH63_9PLEO|nr:unnamed protein product [Periconia digitata]